MSPLVSPVCCQHGQVGLVLVQVDDKEKGGLAPGSTITRTISRRRQRETLEALLLALQHSIQHRRYSQTL